MKLVNFIIALFCLMQIGYAQTTFTVTNTNDSGVGSLRQAILDAEADPGADIIDATSAAGTITLASSLPNVTQGLTINGNPSVSLIVDGNNTCRPFFIGGNLETSTEAPVVALNDLTIQNGLALGENATGNSGGGAGMGGAMFINNGQVTMTNVVLDGNVAQGGIGGNSSSFGGQGGDGPFSGSGGSGATDDIGGGGFISIENLAQPGAYGGGGGGGVFATANGAAGREGGFGAGGGGGGGHFGAALGSGGSGGPFGGNGGDPFDIANGLGGGGAGLGGAIFVRAGSLTLENTTLSNNTATAGLGGTGANTANGANGQGRGGAIFNGGGTVTASFFTFSGNTATTGSPDTHGSVTLITNVAITADPIDRLDINEGMDVSFSVTASGTIETYQWQVDDGNGFTNLSDNTNYSGTNTDQLDITCVPRAFHNYQYRVQIGGTLNDVTSQAASLTVTNAPDLMATIASTDLVLQCNGESLTFTSSNQNVNTVPGYQWLINGVAVQGETADTFTGAVNEGDVVSLELSEPSSCFPRPVAISNSLIVQRMKVDTVVITNTLPGRNDVGSLPYYIDQTRNLPCNDIITVMDLRQLPQGAVITMSQLLVPFSPVHLIGKGSDETTIRVSSFVSVAMTGEFHKIEGIRLEDVSGLEQDGIVVRADSLVMRDVIVSGFNFNDRSAGIEYEDNSSNYYIELDSVQLLNTGSPIEIDIRGDGTATGSIKIRNSVIKNGLNNAIAINIRDVNYQEILVQGNLIQDNEQEAMLATFLNTSGGTFVAENNSVINQYGNGFRFSLSSGPSPSVDVRNNTFSETGIRAFVDDSFSQFPAISLREVNANIINNTMVGVQDVMTIMGNNQVVFANNIVLDEVNGVTLLNGAMPDYAGSGHNIGIDLGANNDLTSTTLEVIQSLTLADPNGTGMLVYQPVECGPAVDLANETLAPVGDQFGQVRVDPDIGAVEGTFQVDDFIVSIDATPFPFPGDVTFTPSIDLPPSAPVRMYTYEWFINSVSSSTDEVFNAMNLVVGDEVQVQVTPDDAFCLRPSLGVQSVNIREAFSLQSTSIPEDVALGTAATQIVPDESLSAGATFNLVAGAGDTDNASFGISGTDLLLTSGLDFETDPSLSIRLSVSDGGQMIEQAFAISVTDVNDPPVFTSTPTLSLERDAAFDYDITTSDDEGSIVAIEGVTIPSWLTFNLNAPAPETILVTTEQTGIPKDVQDFVVDAAGNYYYTDRVNDAIYKMDVMGNQTILADQNSASPIFSPMGMDISADGTIYVAVFSGGPNFNGGIYTIVNNVVAFLMEIEQALEIAVSDNNIIYVLSRSKLHKIENGVATVVAGTNSRSITDGPVGVGEFANPSGMGIASDGTVWFVDTGRIRFVTTDGTITTVVPDPANSDVININSLDLVVDPLNNVYFDDGSEIIQIPAGTSNFKRFAGGSGGVTIDGDQNTARWGRVGGLYLEQDGDLWTLGASANDFQIPQELRKVVIPLSTYSLNGTASISGEFPVTLRASDGDATTDQNFTIEVASPLQFESDPLLTATEGAQYLYNPSANHKGGTAFTYSFTLPDWLSTSTPFTPTSFLNLASGMPGIAPLSGANAAVTNEAIYTIQGSNINGIKLDGRMLPVIDFSSLNPVASLNGPVITSNANGELYFAFKVGEDGNSQTIDKLIKVDPSSTPTNFMDLGNFSDITDIDVHENGVIILERRLDNSVLVGDISIVDDAGMVTSVITNSSAEGLNVGLDGKIYFVGGSNFQPTNHSEVIVELALNGTTTNRNIFDMEEVYSVQDLVVDALGNAYVHYEGLDMSGIFDSYFYLPAGSDGSGGSNLFMASSDINTFEITGFTRFGSTNDIVYITNNTTTGTSDLNAYADNAIISGFPGPDDGGVNAVQVTLDDGVEPLVQSFEINVAFINDDPTDILLTASSIDENNVANVSVGSLSTLDADNVSGDIHTYTLVPGDGDVNNAQFSIDGDALVANESFDAEAIASVSVRVRSTDQAGSFIEKSFVLTINNLNEAPTAILLSNATVAENEASGTLIGTLSTTDQDVSNPNLTFELLTGSNFVQIIGNQLQTSASLDFESNPTFDIAIRANDGPTGTAEFFTLDQTFTITVTDVSDPPVFTTQTQLAINENTTAIITLVASDEDPGTTFTYSLIGGSDQGLFTLTGAELSFTNAPDFENPADVDGNNEYIVQARVNDGTNNTDITITITVQDLNDESPLFTTTNTASVSENTTSVLSFVATDADAGSALTYSLVGGADQLAFSLTGADLSFATAPNFESPGDANTNNVYEVTVRASDGINNTDLAISVTVTDVNESPVFTTGNTSLVAENTTAVTTLASTDVDANSTISYSLVGGADQSSFSLSGASLSFASAPNFESATDANTDNVYEVTIQVSDGLNTADLALAVTVSDINEPPVFTTTNTVSIAENITTVATLAATDVDAGSAIVYSLAGGTDQSLFSLSGADLSFASAPSFESATDANTDNVFEVTVRASDGTNNTDLALSVTITDANEAPNSLTINNSKVVENAAIGTVVGVLSSTDPDASFSPTYTVSSTETNFSISGENLITSAAFDFETQNSYEVVVTVADAGGLSLNETLTISIVDVEEGGTEVTYSISGTVTDPTGGFLMDGSVIALDIINLTSASSLVQPDGTYSIGGLAVGDYTVFVVPDEASFASTFFGGYAPVNDPNGAATVITLGADRTDIDIQVQSKPAEAVDFLEEGGAVINFQAQQVAGGGSRIVKGRVAMGEPIPNTLVILNTENDEYVADGLTDEQGNISFTGLPTATYKLLVDVPGVGIVSTEVIAEEGEETVLTGLIDEGGIAFEEGEVLSADLTPENRFEIYPNPISSRFTLGIENDHIGDIWMLISTLDGKRLYESKEYKSGQKLKLEKEIDLAPGIFLLQIRYDNQIATRRIIVSD